MLAGDDRATVAIIEYSDYQCPFCGTFERDTRPEIDRKYLHSGQVLLAFRHHPLTTLHPLAARAASAAVCAGKQGQFWSMHSWLFGHQRDLADDLILGAAPTLGLEREPFATCLAAQPDPRIADDAAHAVKLGLTATPSFLVGRIRPDRTVSVTAVLVGAKSMKDFQAAIDPLLSATARSQAFVVA